MGKGVGEPAVAGEVLPAVRRTDIAGALMGHRDVGGDAHRPAEDRRVEVAPLHPCGVVITALAEMGRRDDPQTVRSLDVVADQQDVPQRIGQNFDGQPVVVAHMHDGEQRQVGLRLGEPVLVHALEVDPAVLAEQIETEVADFRPAGRRPVDLVDDPVADRHPQPGIAERRGYEILVAGRPGWRNSRCSERLSAHLASLLEPTPRPFALLSQPVCVVARKAWAGVPRKPRRLTGAEGTSPSTAPASWPAR